MAALSRVETMRVIEETGKYSAVVIGAINNPGDAARARAMVEDDIKNLYKQIRVAERAAQYLLIAEHGSACHYPHGGPCSCKVSTGGTITSEEGSHNGRESTDQSPEASTAVPQQQET